VVEVRHGAAVLQCWTDRAAGPVSHSVGQRCSWSCQQGKREAKSESAMVAAREKNRGGGSAAY
jgi:hypothetical protein